MPSPNLTKGAARHPEKRRNEDKLQPRRPDWLRVKAPRAGAFSETKRLMRDLDLVTVCEEAACPNIGECWANKHATMMILGACLLYTSPSPRDQRGSRMPSSA